jgi:phage host-nuclease inhibitor protein Gam
MLNRLDDLRDFPETIIGAKVLFGELAQRCIALAARDAQFEKRIARLKADHAATTEELRNGIANMEDDLTGFIESHRDLFKDPRKVKTDFGAFGLQAVNDVVIEDEDAAMKAVVKRRFEDCFQVATRLVKTALKARLEAGEKIPGVVVRSGDTAVYKVEKSLLDRAKNESSPD